MNDPASDSLAELDIPLILESLKYTKLAFESTELSDLRIEAPAD